MDFDPSDRRVESGDAKTLMVPPARTRMPVRDDLPRTCGTSAGRPAVAPIGRIAVASAVAAALLAWGADTRAEHECGPPEPGVEIVCSSSNYDPARDGNIFYGPGEANEDFAIRLGEDLAIHYDREAPGDDVRVPPDDPEIPRYSAVWVTPWETGGDGSGALTLRSFADVTSNGRGISMGHYGASGPLRMEILGGTVMTTGEESHAIHSYHEGTGDTDVIVRSLTAGTDGTKAVAIVSSHWGEGSLDIDVGDTSLATQGEGSVGIHGAIRGTGDLTIDVRDTSIATEGAVSDGVASGHFGAGDVTIGLRDVEIDTAGRLAYGLFVSHGDAGDFRLGAQDLAIRTTGLAGRGVVARHSGSGKLDFHLESGIVSTTGANADGILGFHRGQGELDIELRSGAVSTTGANADGILGLHSGSGELDVELRSGTVSTAGTNADGIAGLHRGQGGLEVGVDDFTVATAGDEAEGVYAEHSSDGDANVDVRRTGIATEGAQAEGILAQHEGTGALDVVLRDLDVTTAGHYAEGVLAAHAGTGGVGVDARDIVIATTGKGSDAILAGRTLDGDVDIRIHGGVLSTRGVEARGIGGVHKGAGAIALDLRDTTVSTTGEHADAVAIEHEGSGPARITVDGGSVRAAGLHANGIRIGRPSHAARVEGAGAVEDADSHDRSVTVNAPVRGGPGDGAGILLADGGSVFIGPRGRVGAASGVAIRAAGDTPRLLVDMQLDGRRVAEIIGDHLIRNDSGKTTIRVNGVVLHDGASGATGLEVPNGARNVTIVETPTIAGRTFSHEDFREVHAPRAAVHEALPGFLHRLDPHEPADPRIATPGSPAWVRFSGARESHAPERASVGAEFAFDRVAAEAGLDLPLGEHATAFVSVRRLRGSVDVTAPTGGGEIVTDGTGVAVGVAVDVPDGPYLRGRFSRATYTSDLSSDTAGPLAADIGARVRSLDLEAGRYLALNDEVRLTPRAWLARTTLEVDGFTDSRGSRVLVHDVARLTGGAGVVAESARAGGSEGAALSFRASLDIARTLRGRTTRVDVSGEALESELPATRLLLGLGGMFRTDRLSVEANVRVGGFASGSAVYGGAIRIGWSF